ncbi:uncharacterized protein N7482_007147 [Penicillium canariense]|uniref:Uncharacterized protein n=1 Tax=Penicillium canariense TaxID=189055 RepID=A0A9W9LK14_9EURO|nr:uncharacterized protein N7482_007147 [Penicillium canariense]KAJ5160143.1 hypothetical protein N7482_007147 [Penicillium canariense]
MLETKKTTSGRGAEKLQGARMGVRVEALAHIRYPCTGRSGFSGGTVDVLNAVFEAWLSLFCPLLQRSLLFSTSFASPFISLHYVSAVNRHLIAQLDDGAPPNRLIEIADSFPDDLIVRCFVTPFARHSYKALLAVMIFIYGSFITCNFWDDGKVCDRRLTSLLFFMGLGFMILIGYTAHLRRKLERQKRLPQDF